MTDDKVKVKKVQLEKAIRALVQLNNKRTANENPLFAGNAETMNVIFNLSKIPEKRKMKPMLIELPHPMFDDKSEVCFFSKDPQKNIQGATFADASCAWSHQGHWHREVEEELQDS